MHLKDFFIRQRNVRLIKRLILEREREREKKVEYGQDLVKIQFLTDIPWVNVFFDFPGLREREGEREGERG